MFTLIYSVTKLNIFSSSCFLMDIKLLFVSLNQVSSLLQVCGCGVKLTVISNLWLCYMSLEFKYLLDALVTCLIWQYFFRFVRKWLLKYVLCWWNIYFWTLVTCDEAVDHQLHVMVLCESIFNLVTCDCVTWD